MFQTLGSLVARYWPILLGAWIVLSVGLALTAPNWEQATDPGGDSGLPAHSPSVRGQELFEKAFPHARLGSSVVIVLSRRDAPLTEADKEFVGDELHPALEDLAYKDEDKTDVADRGVVNKADVVNPDGAGPKRKTIVSRVESLSTKVAGPLFVSGDKRATVIVVDLTTHFQDRTSWPTIQAVEALIERMRNEGKAPAGLDIALTGSAVVGRDVALLERQSAADIEHWTIVLVILLLLVIYRAPLLALIPLLTVFVAVQISLKLLAISAAAGIINLSESLRIFITVLAYGAGVDYCLFLTSRYREELQSGTPARESTAKAIAKVGAALTASAATVIGGIGMLSFGQFGRYQQAGFSIPFCLVIVLFGTLTFSASLLCLAGRWAFWPHFGARQQAAKPSFWQRVGDALLARPGIIWLGSVAVMLPFAVIALTQYQNWNYGLVSALPEGTPSVCGTRMLVQHFSPGMTGPITVLFHDAQLDFRSPEGRQAIAELTERLQKRFPNVPGQELKIAELRCAATPTGITPAAREADAQLAALSPAARETLRDRTVARYFSDAGEFEGHVARLDVVLDLDPLSRPGIEGLNQLVEALPGELPKAIRSADMLVIGPTATLRDLQIVTTSDLRRIELLVPAVVFAILILVLRDVIVSLYLIASVLFSYFVTLGMTVVLFWALDPAGFAGLDWKVPILLFAILVAVGEDYNIFLMTRVNEERERHGPTHGVITALVKTGGIISSCGFIMAGTFASLLAGSLLELKQLGFALAVGVLLDTLVVRPILVPAFLLLIHRPRASQSALNGQVTVSARQLNN
jgi:RND superfamily putative drug exporter